jgi:hypothetical protein
MMTEARAGFTAFNDGPKDDREVDFVLLRQRSGGGQSWVGADCMTTSSPGAPRCLNPRP